MAPRVELKESRLSAIVPVVVIVPPLRPDPATTFVTEPVVASACWIANICAALLDTPELAASAKPRAASICEVFAAMLFSAVSMVEQTVFHHWTN